MIPLLLAALLLLSGSPSPAAEPDLPCVLCHPSRDRAAFEILSSLPGVSVREESGQAFVCYSCHNGSVVDSRSVLWRGAQHPTAFVPNRPLPKGYPLYSGRRFDCGTCHSPHGKGTVRWLRGSGDGQTSCAGCHPDWAEAHVGRRPGAGAQRAVQALGATLGAGGRMVCGTCHRLHGGQGKALLVTTSAEGKETLCVTCHPEVGSTTVAGGKGRASHPCSSCHEVHAGPSATRKPATVSQRCETCHAGRTDRHLGLPLGSEASQAVRDRGGLVAEGRIGCPTCHKIHGGGGSKLLVADYGARKDDLCRLCHGTLAVKGQPPGLPSQPCADCHASHSAVRLLFTDTEAGPCGRCHPDRGRGGREHPAPGPACSDCHSIHQPAPPAAKKGGLLRISLAGGALCLPCHPNREAPHGPASIVAEAARPGLLGRGLQTGAGGELECTTCHRVHAAPEPRLLRVPRLLSCLYCHPAENPFGPDGPKPGTHPIGVYLRKSQRKTLEAAGAIGETGATLECSSCHPAHREDRPRPGCVSCHAVEAAADSHGGKKGCTACHSIHGTGAPEAACVGCHTSLGEGLHSPKVTLTTSVLSGFGTPGSRAARSTFGCPTCHDPHGTGRHRLRRKDPGGVCLGCHPTKADLLAGPHRPTSDDRQPCTPCHPAHGTAKPPEADPLGSLCRSCHGGDLRVLANHGPSGPPAWKRVNGALPLFDRSGRRNPYGFVSCPTCHDVHLGPGRLSLRKEARDPPDLCLACHAEKASLLGSRHDPRGKGGGAACSVCHPVHGRGDQPPFWTLRSEASGTWNDRMCSPCHGPPADAPSPHGGRGSHPVNIAVPDSLRTTTLPLYDARGGRAGRLVTCSTCHDLHGALGTDGKRIPRYLRRSAANGDLCASCHEQEAAVVGTPHDLTKTRPSAVGPCGPCHAPHRAMERPPLWGLPPGQGDYVPNTACRSCHRQGGPVESKYLLLQYHMKDGEVIRSPRGTIYLQRPMSLLDEWSVRTGAPPIIPLYDRSGRSGPEGNLQCVSCHDPHRWSPLGAFVKPSFGSLAPNVPTRFLRLKDPALAEKSVCAVCHPKDPVERYQKYHQVWEELGAEFQ
ncbi:MAG: hypothetical protein HZB55_21535 [Deltaproteobacteria bacterium]|nr:hypothetical protein [Deltaproteobacteria bacterium]